jgi:hypothetical protein
VLKTVGDERYASLSTLAKQAGNRQHKKVDLLPGFGIKSAPTSILEYEYSSRMKDERQLLASGQK